MAPKALVFSKRPLLGGRRENYLPTTGVRQQKEKRRMSARSDNKNAADETLAADPGLKGNTKNRRFLAALFGGSLEILKALLF
jgi:hypothetical protein